MQSIPFIIAAAVAGALVPFQGGANAALGRALGHPLWATLISLAISAACIIPVMIVAKVPLPTLGNLAEQPRWVWIGGIAGVIYITAAILLMPRLGAAGFMTAVIAGQAIASLIIDHFGGVGLEARPVEPVRLIGVMMVILGAAATQWNALIRA